MTEFLFYPTLFILGLIVGSFLNVCIWRLPREESIILPSSHCLKCHAPIRFYDNIPIISYLLLGGHCRGCGERISWEYPLVEFLTCMLFLSLGWRFGPSWPLIPYLFFIASLVVITFIDIHYYIIPDVISFPGIVLGFFVSFFPFMSREYALRVPYENLLMNFLSRFLPFISLRSLDSVIGIIVWWICFSMIAIIGKWIWKRDALGGGDIKLIAMIAAFLGWQGGIVTVFWASLIGSIFGLFLIVIRRRKRESVIPFGPFLCLGALISLLYGPEMIRWYQNLL